MKRIIVYVLLLAMALFIISCADLTTAKGTVDYMIEHLKRGNVEEAAKVTTKPEAFEPLVQANKDPVQAVALKKLFEKGKFEVGNEIVEGDKATVDVKMTVLSGEASTILRQLLTKAKDELASDLTEEQIKEELDKAADQVQWNGLTTQDQHLRYHLHKEGDRWKIDSDATEDLNKPKEETTEETKEEEKKE